jgi:beta-galactosidase
MEEPREILFNNDWKFHRGGCQSAEDPGFDDSGWRQLDLPHDWSIEDLPGTDSPFDKDAISQVSGGFTTGGTGWYRKTFTVPGENAGKTFIIQFDGVYMNAQVWVNGRMAGRHPYGYTTFWFDITRYIKPGEKNVIAVKVMNEGENSRWYSGSGIYRHVWLKVLDNIHINQWGTWVTTPEVSETVARVEVRTGVKNSAGEDRMVTLRTRIAGPGESSGREAELNLKVSAGAVQEFVQFFEIEKPALWSTGSPVLYHAVQEVVVDQQAVDRTETSFGIRSISFDVSRGFLLNGQPVLLKGGCVHHDNGPLGAKAFDRAEERRVELLKASGFNAVRCAHNPPSRAFLEACDRLGMLVIDEAFDMWEVAKNPFDYHLYFKEWWRKDIENMILRDRNHPSIIMWSTGNEIPERGDPKGVETSRMLAEFIRKIDPTRPVTSAVNGLNPGKDPYFATLDIAGYNYASGGDHWNKSLYQDDHKRVPERIIYEAESYPLEAFHAWMGVLDNDFVIGDFVWTAFDYLGEASIGWLGYWQNSRFFPWNIAWCGDIDICGWKRPQSFFRDALWKENQISVFVKPPVPSFPENPERQAWSKWHWHDVVSDWNWQGYEGSPMDISVYSSCTEVELFLNGKSLGKKKNGRSNEFTNHWQVPYQAGELKATGYSGKKKVCESIIVTAGETTRIKARADRNILKSGGQDLSYVTVELTDKDGNLNPKAENLLKFSLEGPGEIIAVANANPVSLESYQQPKRHAWKGKCLVIVRSGKEPGNAVLRIESEGFATELVDINSK